jgi:hypothetical protein
VSSFRKISPLALWLVAGLVSASAFGAELDPTSDLPGSDRPPVGRSLFDYLAVSDDGSKMDVVFPIEALMKRIEQRTGAKPTVTMLPRGRSLQRDHSGFDSPRLVFAFDNHGKQSAEDLGAAVKDRLYIGYAEKANQLEVISYNAAAGRFEFQIVHDYKQDGERKLAYASRGLCTKCHHNGAPIFSPNPWPETNGSGATPNDHKIADLIKQKVGDKYHGYNVEVPRDIPYEVDNSTDRANYVIPYQKLWMEGCGGATAEAAQCRASVLQFALELAFTTPSTFSQEGEQFATLKATWEKTWPNNLGGGIQVPNPNLLPYDPLLDTGTNQGFVDLGPGLTDEEKNRLQGMLANSQVPQEVDPLFQFLAPLEIWKLDSICFGKCVIYGLNRFFTDDDKKLLRTVTNKDFGKVKAAIGQMLADADGSLSNRPFRRAVVMKALLKRLGQNVPTGGMEDDNPNLPAPQVDGEVQPPPTGESGGLAKLREYCLPCHEMLPGKRGFLQGDSDDEILEKVGAQAAEIVKRLEWTKVTPGQPIPPAAPGHAYMPPRDDDPESPRTRLEQNKEDAKIMIDFVNSL